MSRIRLSHRLGTTIIRKTLTVILIWAFLFTNISAWADGNTNLSPSLRTNASGFKEVYKAAAICRFIEKNGEVGDASSIQDILIKLHDVTNKFEAIHFLIPSNEVVIEVPSEGLAIRYFDPAKANTITPYSNISKLETKVISPQLNRQIIHRTKALPAPTSLSQYVTSVAKELGALQEQRRYQASQKILKSRKTEFVKTLLENADPLVRGNAVLILLQMAERNEKQKGMVIRTILDVLPNEKDWITAQLMIYALVVLEIDVPQNLPVIENWQPNQTERVTEVLSELIEKMKADGYADSLLRIVGWKSSYARNTWMVGHDIDFLKIFYKNLPKEKVKEYKAWLYAKLLRIGAMVQADIWNEGDGLEALKIRDKRDEFLYTSIYEPHKGFLLGYPTTFQSDKYVVRKKLFDYWTSGDLSPPEKRLVQRIQAISAFEMLCDVYELNLTSEEFLLLPSLCSKDFIRLSKDDHGAIVSVTPRWSGELEAGDLRPNRNIELSHMETQEGSFDLKYNMTTGDGDWGGFWWKTASLRLNASIKFYFNILQGNDRKCIFEFNDHEQGVGKLEVELSGSSGEMEISTQQLAGIKFDQINVVYSKEFATKGHVTFSNFRVIDSSGKDISVNSKGSMPIRVRSANPVNIEQIADVGKTERSKAFRQSASGSHLGALARNISAEIEKLDKAKSLGSPDSISQSREKLSRLIAMADAITQQTYNRMSAKYKQLRGRVPEGKDLADLERFLDLSGCRRPGNVSVKEKIKVLDVGTGLRDISWLSDQLGVSAVGIDYAESVVESIRKERRDADVRRMNMLDLEFSNEEFDGVRFQATLHHQPIVDSEQGADVAIKEAHRVLKPGGICYVFVKAETDERRGFMAIDTGEGLGARFYQFYSEESLQQLLDRNGFKLVGDIEKWTDNRGEVNLIAFAKSAKISVSRQSASGSEEKPKEVKSWSEVVALLEKSEKNNLYSTISHPNSVFRGVYGEEVFLDIVSNGSIKTNDPNNGGWWDMVPLRPFFYATGTMKDNVPGILFLIPEETFKSKYGSFKPDKPVDLKDVSHAYALMLEPGSEMAEHRVHIVEIRLPGMSDMPRRSASGMANNMSPISAAGALPIITDYLKSGKIVIFGDMHRGEQIFQNDEIWDHELFLDYVEQLKRFPTNFSVALELPYQLETKLNDPSVSVEDVLDEYYKLLADKHPVELAKANIEMRGPYLSRLLTTLKRFNIPVILIDDINSRGRGGLGADIDVIERSNESMAQKLLDGRKKYSNDAVLLMVGRNHVAPKIDPIWLGGRKMNSIPEVLRESAADVKLIRPDDVKYDGEDMEEFDLIIKVDEERQKEYSVRQGTDEDVLEKEVSLSMAAENINAYMSKNEALFKDAIGVGKEDILIRVPITDSLRKMSPENIQNFFNTLQIYPDGTPTNCYVELFNTSGTGNVDESVYGSFGLQRKPLPKGFERKRTN
ncbi:MAG: methyltransferase domain-containing protein, partial [bacterium]|nr:methyltransferase domain-containing protein [bacterium]